MFNRDLPNGAYIEAIDFQVGIVLASRQAPDDLNKRKDYVTWCFPIQGGIPNLKETQTGHYIGYDLKEARKDFRDRCRGIGG